MYEVVPKSRYIPLTQQRWSCVPTCIQIVMLRHNIPLVPAELIGHSLGLIVPDEDKKYFWNARTGTKPTSGYGTQIDKADYHPNKIFESMGIPLQMSWSLINKFPSFESFLGYIKRIDYSNDYLVCYDWGVLFEKDHHGGHVCVLDKVDLINETMTIVDPDYHSKKWHIIQLEKMFEAMKYHGESNLGGFWEIKKI